MMGYLRNPEVRREAVFYTVGTVLFAAAGFFMGIASGVLVTAACLLFAVGHFVASYRRYRKIGELGRSIDGILHGDNGVQIGDYSEGELSVLQSEIGKMTVRLRENADCLQREKLRLTDAIADISHQLRTPLTALNLIVSMLGAAELTDLRRLQLTREQKKLLGRIDWLVDTLLKMARIDAGTALFKKETVPVPELIRRATEPLAVPMDVRGQTLTVRVGTERYTGDLSWSVEAVGNILKNCMEHTPDGGEISVTARETGIFTELIICDTGPGIDPEDLGRLFERFYKGKDAAEGSFGIGLSLSRMIITAQNGTVKAENRAEGGAVFTLRFYKGVV